MPLSKLTRGSCQTAEFEEPIYKKRADFFFGATLTSSDQVLLWSSDRGGDGNYYAWAGAFPKTVAASATPATSGGLGASAWVSVGDASVGLSYATPMMFGAVGGMTDDKLALQACINFCQLTGREMRIDRSHRTSGTLFVTSAVKIQGAMGGASIIGTSATGDVLSVSVSIGTFNGGLTLNNVEVMSSVVKTSGYLINLNGSYNTMMDQIILTNGFNGLGITGVASQTTHIRNLVSANHSNNHVDILNVSADVIFENCYLHGQAANIQSAAGFNIKQAGDVTLRNVNTAWCGTDVIITPGSGQRVQALFIEGGFFDTSIGYGIYMLPTGTGKINLVKASGAWVCTHNQGGILIGGPASSIGQVDLINVTASGNLNNGLLLNPGSANVTVMGGSFSQNASSGIAIAAGVGEFKIIGATCGPSGEFGGNGQWGILIDSGSGGNYDISHCKLQNNGLGGLSEGATGGNRSAWPNVGGSSAIRPSSAPAVDWGISYPANSQVAIAAGGVYALQVGGGIVAVADESNGNSGLFYCYNGIVTKLAGATAVVSGVAGASQLSVDFSGGNYRVGNGYATPKTVTISTIKTSSLS